MAEYLLREKMGSDSEWEIRSAGVSTTFGFPASSAAVLAMSEVGIDMTSHKSCPLSHELISVSDVIVVMTSTHRDQICRTFSDAEGKTYLLKSFAPGGTDEDVPDPIGASIETYRKIRDEIDDSLPGLIEFACNLDI